MPNGAQQYEEKPSKKSASRESTKDILSKLREGDGSETFYRKILAKDIWSENEAITGTLDYLIELIDAQEAPSNLIEIKECLSEFRTFLETNSTADFTGLFSFRDCQEKLRKKVREALSLCTAADEKATLGLLKPLCEEGDLIDLKSMYGLRKCLEGHEDYNWNKLFSKKNIEKDYKQFKQEDRDKKKSGYIWNNLTEEEKSIVVEYTGKEYRTYNSIARGQMDGTDQQKHKVNLLYEIIGRNSLEKQGKYYRGLRCLDKIKFLLSSDDRQGFSKLVPEDVGAAVEYINTNLRGHYLVDEGFSSMSESKVIAGFDFKGFQTLDKCKGVFIKINTKSGIPALPIIYNSENSHEKEVLLNKGMRLKIESAKMNSMGTLTINVTAEAPTSNSKDKE